MAEHTLTLCTIGFTGKSLRRFIGLLKAAGVAKVVDVRLNNTSQLSGYAKKDDLAFILETVGIGYEHCLELAPTDELFQSVKKGAQDWPAFAAAFLRLIGEREVQRLWESPVFNAGTVCLLCSEPSTDQCHRRLVAEYLQSVYPETEVRHLK